MRRRVLAGACLCAGLLSGCSGGFFPEAHDIQMVELVQTMGLDAGEEGQVDVTFSSGLRRVGDSGETKAPTVRSAAASTVYDATLKVQGQSDHYVSFGHTGTCVVGEDAAREGLTDLIDFLERDTEMRLSTNLYIVKGGVASEVIWACTSDDTSISDKLEALAVDAKLDSTTQVEGLKELLGQLEYNGCGVAAAVRLEEDKLLSDGYACFQNNALVGWIGEEDGARGVNILRNQVSGGNVTVTLSDGSIAALRLETVTCQWKPTFQGETLTGVAAQVKASAGLEELRGEAELSDEQMLEELKSGLSGVLRSEAVGVLQKSQEWNADILHIQEELALAAPAKKKALAEQWETLYQNLSITVEVEPSITRSYDVGEPLREKEESSKD